MKSSHFATIVLFLSYFMMNPVSAEEKKAPPLPAPQALAAGDCVSEFIRTDKLIRIKTKNGVELAITLDSYKRIASVKTHRGEFIPRYDGVNPTKIVAYTSKESGDEHEVIDAQDGPLDEEKTKQLQALARSVPKCGDIPASSSAARVGDDPASTDLIDNHGGGGFGEDWGSYGFAEVYITAPYWVGEQTYLANVTSETAVTQGAQQRECIKRVTACQGLCDDAAAKRNYACAIGAAVFAEIPIGSAMYAVACIAASDYHKGLCTDKCQTLDQCF